MIKKTSDIVVEGIRRDIPQKTDRCNKYIVEKRGITDEGAKGMIIDFVLWRHFVCWNRSVNGD